MVSADQGGGKLKITWTAQVTEALRLFDQPLSGRQLMDLTGGSLNQISATLHWLQKKHVIEAVLVQDEPFWFLTGEDEREKTVEVANQGPTKVRKRGYRIRKMAKPGSLMGGKKHSPITDEQLFGEPPREEGEG